ncbi:HEPN family nuclease, partial [Aliivibrio fischeri]
LCRRYMQGDKMDSSKVNSMIATVRMNNHLLGLIDHHKNNSDIRLSELLAYFESSYADSGFSLDNHHFFNQNQLMTSLLVYVVYPKESFWDQLPKCKLKELNEKWGLHTISEDYDLQFLVRKIRNSISHGRVIITENLEFEFEDNNFKVSLSGTLVMRFTQALAYWCLTKDVELKGLF